MFSEGNDRNILKPDVFRDTRRFGVRITWHGHSCFEIKDSKILVIDPHDGYSVGLRKPDTTADVVAVSHDHFDHNKADIVSGQETQVVTSSDGLSLPWLNIHGYDVCHDTKGGEVRGKNIMYKFTMDGITCLHMGDLGHIIDTDLVEKIGHVDILFLPVGGTFTIDHKDAVSIMDLLKPTITIPMHYRVPGISLAIDEVKPFLKGAKLPVLKVGYAIDFISEDLPDHQEIWLFNY